MRDAAEGAGTILCCVVCVFVSGTAPPVLLQLVWENRSTRVDDTTWMGSYGTATEEVGQGDDVCDV